MVFVKYLDFIKLLPPTIKFLISASLRHPYDKPCLFTVFKLKQRRQFFFGEKLNRIDEVANYNQQHQLSFSNSKLFKPVMYRLKLFFLPARMVGSFCRNFNVGLYCERSKKLDILNSGHGFIHFYIKLSLINSCMKLKSLVK